MSAFSRNGSLAGFMACLMLVGTLALSGCTNSDKARETLRRESEDNYGVMRTVTAYGVTGEQIGQWHGKIDVQYTNSTSDMHRVDLVFFDGEKPVDRVIISGGIVVVDND